MTDTPPRVLLWSTPALPTELRGLLVAVIALFAATSLALTFAAGHGWQTVVCAVAAGLASAGITLWLAWSYDTSRALRTLLVALLAAAALLAVAYVLTGQPTTVLMTGLPFAFAIAWYRPFWLAPATAATAVGVAAVLAAVVAGHPFPVSDVIIMIALLGAATVGFAAANIGWQWQRRLDQHAADQREFAVTRERLRFATDLHDIQGHTLLAIKLKAELARRSIDRDPDTARHELRAIEDLAAEADRRTRDLAHGYRTVNLAAELANVEQLLGAAGIEVAVQRTGVPSPESDAIFAALAKEAASNILRHADASTVRIEVDDRSMAIANDGAQETPGSGTGLAGLQRRFTERGGTFTWQRDGDRFVVTGEVGS